MKFKFIFAQLVQKCPLSIISFFPQKFKTRYCKRKAIVRPKSLIVTKVPPQASATIDSPNVSTACLNEPSLNNDIIESEENVNSAETKVSDTSSKRFFKETLQLDGQAKPSSIITSATQILKEGEQQWLNSEVCFLFSFS